MPGRSAVSEINAAIACVACLIACAFVGAVSLHWTLANPHIAGWDQIQYVDIVLKDALVHKLDGDGALRDALFNDYRWLPPGFRFLGMPLVLIHQDTEIDFRLLSLAVYTVSLVALFDAARRISSKGIAAGMVAMVAVAPVWVRGSEDFMSETAMIPAIVLILWCLVRETESDRPWFTPVLMGAGLGLGMLAKFSMMPMTLIIFIMLGYSSKRTDGWLRLMVTILVATLMAWPSYSYNGVRYLAYGRFAATWPLDQLPGQGFGYAHAYISNLAESVFGVTLFALPVMIILVTRRLIFTRSPRQGFIGIGCGAILISMLLPHVFGHNQNPRYLIGGLPALALFLACGSGQRLATIMASISITQATAMLAIMVTGPYHLKDNLDHTGVVADSWRSNQTCDFSQAVQVVSSRSAKPVIKFYGVTGAVNHVQIEMAFLRAGILADVIPADLTRPDLSDPDKIGADEILVVNTPTARWRHGFVADPNAHNNDVRTRLLHDPAFTLSNARSGNAANPCSVDVFLARR